MRSSRLLTALLLTILLLSGDLPRAGAEGSIRNIYINGNQYPGVYGVMSGNHAMLQVRTVMEALGNTFGVVWSPEDGSTTIYGLPESPVVIRPGHPEMRLKERSVPLPVAPFLHEDRLVAPLEFFRQALGARVEWVSATSEVEITPPPYNQVAPFGPPEAGPATFSALGKDGAGRLYLAVADGPRRGIWRSGDHGATWAQTDLDLPTEQLEEARFVTGDDGRIYLMAHTIRSPRPGGDGWIPIEGFAGPQRPYTPFNAGQVVRSPDDPRWVWALTKAGVQVSQDGGETWQMGQFETVTAAPVRYLESRLLPGGGRELFLLTGDQGVQYSPTGGGQWFRLTGYWPEARVLDAVMDGGRIFLATTSGGVIIPQRAPQPNAIELPRIAPRPIDWGPNLAEGTNSAGALVLDPQAPDTAYAVMTRDGVTQHYRTTDGGQSWEPLAPPFEGTGTFLHHPTESGHYLMANSEGVYLTRDGGETWSVMPAQSSRHHSLGTLTWLSSGRLLASFSGLAGSRLVYTDDFQGFKELGPFNHLSSLVANPAVPGTIFACDWSEAPCSVSHDDGMTWQHLASQPRTELPISLIWSPAAPDELIAGRLVSQDGGENWAELPFFRSNDRVQQIAIDPTDRNRRAAIVATDLGPHQIWVSHDGGQNWLSVGRPSGSTWVNTIRFDGKGRFWVGADTGIWRIEDF